jgi:hypothetical protein
MAKTDFAFIRHSTFVGVPFCTRSDFFFSVTATQNIFSFKRHAVFRKNNFLPAQAWKLLTRT